MRVNSDTGEREYKVYRAERKGDDKYHSKSRTSWTTDKSFADAWGDAVGSPDNYSGGYNSWLKGSAVNIHHAWIPEKHVHSYLFDSRHHNSEKGENEVIVHPHDVNITHTEEHAPKHQWYGDPKLKTPKPE